MQPDSPIADQIDRYVFTSNNPFDRSRPIQLVVPQLMSSPQFMRSIREYCVPPGALAVWFLGQNGFMCKDAHGPLIGIDLYLTDSCAETAAGRPYRMNRQLPIFIEPEDLNLDVFITTHSHQDHADHETIRRMAKSEQVVFVGPYDSCLLYEQCGVDLRSIRLIHAGQTLQIEGTAITATFALPTDRTDLNHTGTLLTFASGVTFFNTGDTAWAELLPSLMPTGVDICAICINGCYQNLAPQEAAAIVKIVAPRVVVPCHYDMLVNNIGSPALFKIALDHAGANANFHMLGYYEPWLYVPDSPTTSTQRTVQETE